MPRPHLPLYHPLPPIPEDESPWTERMSGRGHRIELSTEEQHCQLRITTWFLSKTNQDRTFRPEPHTELTYKYNPIPHPKTHDDKLRSKLFTHLEAFSLLVERNHESISVSSADKNGLNTNISSSYPTPAPDTLDHIVISEDDIQQYGHVLHLPRELYTQEAQSEESTQSWGHDDDAFRVRLTKANTNDNPVPKRGKPVKYEKGYAYWLMKRITRKINDKSFVANISTSEHIANVADAIKETHRHQGDHEAVINSQVNLGMYVYVNCAARCHEKVIRGFEEYCFGRLLTVDLSEILAFEPQANDHIMEISANGLCNPEYAWYHPLDPKYRTLRPSQKEVFLALMKQCQTTLEITDASLDPDQPRSLVNREMFYDTAGRLKFHEFLSIILQNVRQSTSGVVRAKRAVMEAKLSSLSTEEITPIAAVLQKQLAYMYHSYRALNILRSHFGHVLEAHINWLAQIFAAADDADDIGYHPFPPRPSGLHDDFGRLSKCLSNPELGASCIEWVRLLCQQERSMEMLRYRLPGKGGRPGSLSVHILNANTWHVSITAAADRGDMPTLTGLIRGLGCSSTQCAEVLAWLVDSGRITIDEAGDRGTFSGCVHALTLATLIHYIERRRLFVEMSRANLERLRSQGVDGRQAPFLPRAGITSRFRSHAHLAIGGNRPMCRGCRRVLDMALLCGVYPPETLRSAYQNAQWAELDMPPWAPRDAVSTLLLDAREEAVVRLWTILEALARDGRDRAYDSWGEFGDAECGGD